VVAAIGDFYNEKALSVLQAVLRAERNPEIVIAGLKGLAGYDTPEVHSLLLSFLHTNSFRNELADASISAMKSAEDIAFLDPLVTKLKSHGSNFTSRGFAAAIEAVAVLGHDHERKSATREFVASYVEDKRERVRVSALNALGTLGDPGAFPLLDRFAGAAQDTPERKAAEKALAALHEGQKPSEELKALRTEVLELKKANRETQATLDELSKKFKASGVTAKGQPSGKPRTKRENLSSPKQAD
jgi:HEAT repeat protein